MHMHITAYYSDELLMHNHAVYCIVIVLIIDPITIFFLRQDGISNYIYVYACIIIICLTSCFLEVKGYLSLSYNGFPPAIPEW